MSIEVGSFEYNTLFTLTIILLIAKLILIIYLGWEIYKKTKISEKFTYDFQFSLLIVIMCMFLSRILFVYYDFFLYQFDPDKLWIMPNIIVWKIATLINNIGYIQLLFILDKRALKFKFKGILAYILVVVALIQFFYPVYSAEDFTFVSYFTYIVIFATILIPFIFFYGGYKSDRLSKYFYMIAIGAIIYAIGANLVIDAFLGPLRTAFGLEIIIVMYTLCVILKIIGLVLISWGVQKII